MADFLKTMWNSLDEATLVVSTVLVAVFTGLVWLLQKRIHDVTNFASLRICCAAAKFDEAAKRIHAEVLILNTASAPAIVTGWKVLVHDGDYQENVSDGETGYTQLLKAQKFISEKGWVITRDTPTALSITSRLSKDTLTSSATVEINVEYAGGKSEEINVIATIPVPHD